jgi:hypothetical protein
VYLSPSFHSLFQHHTKPSFLTHTPTQYKNKPKVAAVAAVPSFQPDARSQQLNTFAKWIGDDRADKVRRRYGRPLKAVVVTGSGVVGEGGASSS